MKLLDQFERARRVSTPIIAIRTADNAATQYELADAYKDAPLVAWNCVTGLSAVNSNGQRALKNALSGSDPSQMTSPVEALAVAPKFEPETILFAHNVQMFLAATDQTASLVIQAVANLREPYKQDQRTLVLLGNDITLPPEISASVVVLDEPLPTDEQIKQIVNDVFKGAKLTPPDDGPLEKTVDAIRGLPAFQSEQAVAMSLTKAGVDLGELWERKRQTIRQTPGLSIYQGKESFDSIKGYDNAIDYVKANFNGQASSKAILYLDEVEKHLAGAGGGDLSGVKTDMLGALLTWMQDRRAQGMIFIGVPGAGKSAMAKACGNYANVPTISFDLSGMQDSLVGKSGQNIRNALKVVDAVSSGEVLIIATCNSIQALPPELRRRFTLGIFFFDLPDKEGRRAIWDLYCKKPDPKAAGPLSKKQAVTIPNDEGWTGAEIEKCCSIAWRLNRTLVEAAEFIVPVSRSAPEQLANLRRMASGAFIDASKPGVYQFDETQAAATRGRQVRVV